MNRMREYKIFILLFLFVTTSILFFSCTKDDALSLQNDALELQSPYGRWKFRGYGPATSYPDKIFLANPGSYYLTLNKDGTFIGTSSTNEISGKFTIDARRRNISFTQADFYSSNKYSETNDGSVYLSRLLMVKEYRVYTDQLHLYYTDKEYMVFAKPVIH